MPRATQPITKMPPARSLLMRCLEHSTSASTNGSKSKSTSAKVLALSKMDTTRPGIPALTFKSTVEELTSTPWMR